MAGGDDMSREPWDDEDGEDGESSWTEADERRYQARRHEELKRGRRRRRQATSFTVLVLLVLGIGVGAAGVYQGWWDWPLGREETVAGPPAAPQCPTPEITAAAPADTTVTVLNATGRSGLAASVADELTARGLTVAGVDNAEGPVAEVAQVRHGPEGALQARTVGAQVDSALLVDDGRAGTAVELVLGEGYTALRAPEAVAPLITPVPVESPTGCVPPTSPTPSSPTPVTPSATTPATPAPTT